MKLLVLVISVAGLASQVLADQNAHHHNHKMHDKFGHKERTEDGAYAARNAHQTDDGHHEFDHESILGSHKDAEEFDHLSPEESKRRLAVLVTKMDTNQDHFVDRHELKAWILRSFKSLSEEEAAERFDQLDENHDHKLTWDEYVKETYGMISEDGKTNIILDIEHTKQEQKLAAEDKSLWDVSDGNKDGILELEEYFIFFSPEEHPQTLPVILNQTLAEKDKNKDGKIDFQEFMGEAASHHDKEWLLTEKDKFDKDHDEDKDGFLNGNEILKWMVPSNSDVALEETSHLFVSADEDHDDRLSYDEIVNKYDVFVGSEATDYGDHLHNLDQFDHDEL